MEEQYPLCAAESHAAIADSFGNAVDEDVNTSPLGYRWLHTFTASEAFLPRHSTFVTSQTTREQYHPTQRVVQNLSQLSQLQSIQQHSRESGFPPIRSTFIHQYKSRSQRKVAVANLRI